MADLGHSLMKESCKIHQKYPLAVPVVAQPPLWLHSSVREGLKKPEGKFYLLRTRGGRGGGGRRSHSLGYFFATQKPFVCLKEAPKQTSCSLLTSDMLDIASNSVLKTSCTISDTSVADTRKW